MHYHIIGICGTATSALAGLLIEQGHTVSGSDKAFYSPIGDLVRSYPITLYEGFSKDNIETKPDRVVVGNAISRGNPELEAVLNQKLPYTSMTDLIRNEFIQGCQSFVITGTHGKTTTTALTTWLLEYGEKKPGYLIAGKALNFTNHYRSPFIHPQGNAYFVIEGDEYDSAYFDKTPKFLHYLPDIACIQNIEYDHADIYPHLDAILLQFKRFIHLIPETGMLVYNVDDANTREILRYPPFCNTASISLQDKSADWFADSMVLHEQGTTFTLYHKGQWIGEFLVPLMGIYNVRNALSSIAMVREAGISWEQIKQGLHTFKGVSRRLECIYQNKTLRIYNDFAHHPTAIKATLDGLRERFQEDPITVIFEPRSYTAKSSIFQESYVSAFSSVDHCIISSQFEGTQAPNLLNTEVLITQLKQAKKDAIALPGADAILSYLEQMEAKKGIWVLMSNGGFGNLPIRIVSMFQ